MSLTVQQLLADARRLSTRLREHDNSADGVISSAQGVLKEVEAMREFQEDVDHLNSVAHNRPRTQLVLGIQQENRHIRQLQHENKELRAALEESQNAIELIMSKYRQHMSYLVHTTKLDKNLLNHQKSRVLQEKTDQIYEMAGIMQKSIQIDEETAAIEREVQTRLITENKGLREMLEISRHNGSHREPLVGPRMVCRECQTDDLPASPGPLLRLPTHASASCSASTAVAPRPPSSTSSYTSSCSPTSVILQSDLNGAATSEDEDEVTFNTIKRQGNNNSETICDKKVNGFGVSKHGNGLKQCNVISGDGLVTNGDSELLRLESLEATNDEEGHPAKTENAAPSVANT